MFMVMTLGSLSDSGMTHKAPPELMHVFVSILCLPRHIKVFTLQRTVPAYWVLHTLCQSTPVSIVR